MKILFGTDGSSHAQATAHFLAHRIPVNPTRVDLVRVVPKGPQPSGERNGRLEPSTGPRANGWMDQTDWPLTVRGFDVQKRTEWGTPARVLIDLASEGGYDLVAVGAKGVSETPFHDVGGVALALLEHAPAPVLVVRKPPMGANGDGDGPRDAPFRVLVPTDGKAQSHEAVLKFLSLFPHSPMELVVTTAVEDLPQEMVERLAPSELRSYRSYVEGVAEARLKDMVARLEPHGLPVEIRRVHGPPARSIVEAAAAEGADMVVIGSRRVHDTAERHLGGVGGEVARSAPCSVLVVRDRAGIAGGEVRRDTRSLPSFRSRPVLGARKGA